MSHQTSIETWFPPRNSRQRQYKNWFRAVCTCGFQGLWTDSREVAEGATPVIDGARICPRSLKPVDFGPEPVTLDDIFTALGARPAKGWIQWLQSGICLCGAPPRRPIGTLVFCQCGTISYTTDLREILR